MATTKGAGDKQPPAIVGKTKTGGGGGEDEGKQPTSPVVEQSQQDEGAQAVLKRRLDLLRGDLIESQLPDEYEFSLDPSTLVGSWFHRLENGEIVWQGVVVGEPRQGVYLCWIERQEPGATDVQRLIPLEYMVSMDDGYEWRFYDTEDRAREAFATWTVMSEKERS